MAETKIISVEAIQTIAQLKDNIKALKQEIDTLSVGSSDYNKRVVELAENQRALKLAMTGVYGSMTDVAKASKMDADSLNATVAAAKQGTATYNEISSALSRLKQEIKDTPKYLSEQAQALGQVNPAYAELNHKIQALDTSLKGLDADNGVFSRNVGNYVGALQEWGGTLSQVGQIGSQLMGGVMALVGVFSLFGAETDDTKEALQSIVPIFAVLNGAKGLQGIGKSLKTVTAGQKAMAAATAGAAAASTADATAKGAEAVATEAADAAQKSLNASMLANPILAVVAGVIALTAAVAKYVSNANKAKKETEAWKKANEDLTAQFDEQNRALELRQRIDKAQGTTNRELLVQQLNLKNSQIEATKAQLANVQARIAQLNADSAWVRFWKGENKQIKNLEELAKNLTEQIKSLNNETQSLQTDIIVNDIEKGKEAAEKLSKAYEDTLNNALSKAKEEIKKTRTEEQNLNAEFSETVKILESGVTAVDELLKKEKDLKKINSLNESKKLIQQGLEAANNANEEAKAKLRASEYTKRIEKDLKDTEFIVENITGGYKQQETFARNVLGYTEAEIRLRNKEGQVAANNLSIYQKIGQIIKDDLSSSGVTVGQAFKDLDWDSIKATAFSDPELLRKNLGEPIVTALQAYFKNENDIKKALNESASELVTYYGQKIEEELKNGNFLEARSIAGGDRANTLEKALLALFPDDEGMKKLIRKYISDLKKGITEQQLDNPLSDVFFGREDLYTAFASFYDDMKKYYGEIGELTEQQERERFTRHMNLYYGFLDSYGKATADALSAVGDLWEKSLQLRYKQQVESGKMTAEEAEAQAEKSFKAVKALQIGVATVDTATAIMRALSDSTVPSYYVRAANAVAAGIAGAANIATIAMTNFGAPSVNTSSFATPTYTEAPGETVYTYALNMADMAEAGTQNLRVYVTDKDLSDGVKAYVSKQEETSF